VPDVVGVAELLHVGQEGHVAERTGCALVEFRLEKTFVSFFLILKLWITILELML